MVRPKQPLFEVRGEGSIELKNIAIGLRRIDIPTRYFPTPSGGVFLGGTGTRSYSNSNWGHTETGPNSSGEMIDDTIYGKLVLARNSNWTISKGEMGGVINEGRVAMHAPTIRGDLVNRSVGRMVIIDGNIGSLCTQGSLILRNTVTHGRY